MNEVDKFIAKVRNNPSILDSFHPEIAQFWREQANVVEVEKATLENLLIRSFLVLEECKSEKNEQIKMEKLFEAINNDLVSMKKSWSDIHQLLNFKLQEVGA